MIENRGLVMLSSADVKAHMTRIEKPKDSYVEVIANELGGHMFGQPEACKALAKHVAKADTALANPHRPLGVLFFLGQSGVGKCLHGKTPIYDPIDKTTKTVKERHKEGKSFHVYSLNYANNIVITKANPPKRFIKQKMWKVSFSNGDFLQVTNGHRFFSGNGYNDVATLRKRFSLGQKVLLPSISEHALSKSFLNVSHYEKKDANSQGGCHLLSRLYDLLPRWAKGIFRVFAPLVNDVYEPYSYYFGKDDLENKLKHNHHYHKLLHLSKQDLKNLWNSIYLVLQKFRFQLNIFLQFFLYPQYAFQLAIGLNPVYREKEPFLSSRFSIFYSHLLASLHGITGIGQIQVTSIKYTGKSYYYDFEVPKHNNYWACGVFNHNTEMAHALALQQFGDEHSDRLKIIDCGEMQQDHEVLKLTGAPPSYIGFNSEPMITPEWLAEKQKRSIIVFDETEKASPALHKLLLGIMEDARMRTNRGECDFSNSFIIMTSNVGSHEIERIKNGKDSIGFVRSKTQESIEKAGVNALKEHFAPEFVNRLDDIIVFNSLKPEHYSKIYDKFLAELNSDIHKRFEKPPFVATTHEFKDYMLSKIDPDFGGRGMRHAFDRELIQKLADVFIDIDVSNRPIIADFDEGEVVFYTDEIPTKEEPRPEPEKIIIPIDPEIETPESPCASIPLIIKVVDFKEPQIRRKRRRR